MIDDRLDEDIEAGAKMVPQYSTDIVTTDGGWEVRNSRWQYPRHRFNFNLMPNETDPSVIDAFVDIFNAAGGAFEEFLFTPFADYRGTDEAAVELTGTTFQITKNYTRGGVTRQRKISRPKDGTVTVYVDGVEQVSGFTINYSTGVITFGSSKAGQAVTVDFQFDVLVRFMDDDFEIVAITGQLLRPVNVSLIEIRE